MSIYKSGVDAYRDTTKWLAAFTPVTAIIAAAVVAGAPLANSLATSPDAGWWLLKHWLLLLCGVVILACIAAILWRAAIVLSAKPIEALTNLSGDDAKLIVGAFSSGVASPDFYDYASFELVSTTVLADLNKNPPDSDAVELNLGRLRTTYEAVREWKLFVDTRGYFASFLWWTGACVLVLCVIIPTALTQLDSGAAITEPAPATVAISKTGESAFHEETGCSDAAGATFYAVAGTWSSPVLAIAGPGCEFGARWTPSPTDADVLPLPE